MIYRPSDKGMSFRRRARKSILERVKKVSSEEIERMISLEIRVPLRRDGPNRGILNGSNNCQIVDFKNEGGLKLKVLVKKNDDPIWISEKDLDLFNARIELYKKRETCHEVE